MAFIFDRRDHYEKLSGRRMFMALVVAMLCAVTAPTARADTGSASDFIKALGAKAISVLQQKNMSLADRETAFRKILKEDFDIDLIGRFSLGRYWRRANPEQRRDYLAVFGEYVLRTYASKLGGYAGEKLAVVSQQALKNKRDVLVNTQIKRPAGPPIKATWRVRTVKGRQRIIDIMVEGISMAVTQRDTFAAVVRRSGLDGLLEVLRSRSDKATATASAG